MKAKDIMTRPAIAATTRANAYDIALQLLACQISGVPVTEPDGQVLGVVTDSDLLRALQDGQSLANLTALDVMSRYAITVELDTAIEDVLALINAEQIVRVPVTDDGKLVGIISRSDVLRALTPSEFMSFA